ncbi:MAG: hypothetical protein ABSE73_30340 [Planctomycetota bacterium]
MLAKFDPEVGADLQRRLSQGSITTEHVAQLYRLLSTTKEDNDPESIAELLDLTSGMAVEEFRQWVDDRIALWDEKG